MKIYLLLLIILLMFNLLFAKSSLTTVPQVDINRYLGKWYEVGRYPNRFQKDCYLSTATYTLLDNGKIEVFNECRKDNPQGKYKSIRGKAKIVDTKTNAKLKVSFFWPFYGDYWIVGLGDQYEYALVSEPSMKYLWILSRTPQLDIVTEAKVYKTLKEKGFDTDRIIKQ